MDYNKIKEAAQNYEADMTKFLRELVHFPGESCGEKDHVMRIKEEMEKLGFDKVEIDPVSYTHLWYTRASMGNRNGIPGNPDRNPEIRRFRYGADVRCFCTE